MDTRLTIDNNTYCFSRFKAQTRVKTFVTVIFSIICGLLPFCVLINFSFKGVFLDKILLLLFGLLFLFYILISNKKVFISPKRNICLILLSAYIVVNSILMNSCGAFGILCFCISALFTLLIGSSSFFSINIFKKIVVTVSLIATLLVMIQYFCYYFLNKAVSFVPLTLYREDVVSDYGEFLLKGYDYGFGMFRPSAFFVEPAQLSEYSLLALSLLLFTKGKRQYILAVLVTIGIILSTSGIGIGIASLIWFCKFLLFKSKFKIKLLIGIVIIGSIIYLLLDSLGLASIIMSRFELSSSGSGVISRFSDLPALFKELGGNFLFGKGFDSPTKLWLPGFFSLLRQLGIIGLAIYIICPLSVIKKNQLVVACVGLFIILTFVADIISMTYFVFYLCVPYCINFKKGNEHVLS